MSLPTGGTTLGTPGLLVPGPEEATYVGDPDRGSVVARLPRVRSLSAAASAAALTAALHVTVVPAHLRAWWVYGAFVLVLAAAQAALAWRLLRGPTVTTAVVGLVGTVFAVLAYVVSRTVGIPVGPGAGLGDHAGHGSGALVHQPIPGAIGPGVPVMPGLEGNPAVWGVQAVDVVVLTAELWTVVALLALLPGAPRHRATGTLLVVGLGLWGAALLGYT